jgi:DNA-directed RNA polymerase subunit RPC12/RpoP
MDGGTTANELRCPACRARLHQVTTRPLGRNIELGGVCPRCSTRLFAIRRAPDGGSGLDNTGRKRVQEFIDQAA